MQRTNGRKPMLIAAMTLSTLLLAGCGPKVIAVATRPPPELLSCAGEPETPTLPAPGIERDRIVGDWLLAYRAAWGDCSAKVSGVRAWADALPETR